MKNFEIHNWRSIRRYQNKKIEKEKILKILEAGRRAPSWQNLQPWHFLVIDDDKTKQLMSKIVVTKKIILKAPLVITILGDLNGFNKKQANKMIKEQVEDKMTVEEIDSYLDQKRSSPLWGSEKILMGRVLEQLSYSASFMIIEAMSLGIGSCIIGGIENCLTEKTQKYDQVKKELNVPDNYDFFTILTLGYPDENPNQRSRKSLDKICSLNNFKNTFNIDNEI